MVPRQLIKQFVGGAFWSVLSTAARGISALAVNKLFAVYYGPAGITLLSHFQGLIAMLTALPNGGINVGLIRHLAQGQVQDERYRAFFWTGFWLNLLSFVVTIGFVLAFPSFFLGRFEVHELFKESGWYVGVGVVLTALLLLQLFCMSVFLARQALKIYVFLSFFVSGCTTLVMWWAVGRLELPLVLFSFLAGQALGGLLGAGLVFWKNFVPKRQATVSQESLRELGKFVLMAVSTLVGGKFADFVVREMAIVQFSLHDTGMWQAVTKVSDNYTLVYGSIMGMVYYPKIASLLQEEETVKKYVRHIFLTMIPVLAVGLLLVFWTREWLILFLFNKEFLPAKSLFPYHMLGDYFKMVAWVLSYVVAVKAQVKLYILIQLISPLVYVLLVVLLLPRFGVQGITIAYAADWAIFLLFHLYLFRSYFFSSAK